MKDRAKPGELAAFVRRLMISQPGVCVIWPFGKDPDGYGILTWEGRCRRANGLVCELMNGPRPSPKHQAAHSCGNASCVTPRHLRWATNTGNQRDRWTHGTSNRGERHGQHKLTADNVREIRRMWASGEHTQTAIGGRFGILSGSVNNILARRSWAWLDDES